MRSLPSTKWFAVMLLLGGAVYLSPVSALWAQSKKDVETILKAAEAAEACHQWEAAREFYESLLGDPSLKIRDRYHHALRRCWLQRRHQDPSYRKEVLSVDFGQALRMHSIISKTLLDGAIDKKKLDAGILFKKGLEELDAALDDPMFLGQFVAVNKHDNVGPFRAMLKKLHGEAAAMSRTELAVKVSEVAQEAEIVLGVNGTVVAMEMGCGACYAIDRYTVYLTPNQLRELARTLARTEMVGVGLVLGISGNQIVVRDIVMGSPAAQKPIFINDQIIRVNKKPVVDFTLRAVREMLEGKAGESVQIDLLAPGEMKERSVTLVREKAIVGTAWSIIAETRIGYIKIHQFTETTPQEVDGAIQNIHGYLGADMKALILDLRGNGGGVFESAIDTARRFLASGIIASTINQDASKNRVYQAANPKALNVPIVLLVDGGTASAAEVLAGALKDNDRAVLIGQTTFGKSCTQRVLKLPNAVGGVPTGGMKLTFERFFSPKGVAYSGRGIVPHILVDDAEPMSQANMMLDAAMRRAIDELGRTMLMMEQ